MADPRTVAHSLAPRHYAFFRGPIPANQVMMHDGGALMVHDNVVFEANKAGFWAYGGRGGGAVSLPFERESSLLTTNWSESTGSS